MLAAKLGKELNKPAGDVLAALKAVAEAGQGAQAGDQGAAQARRAAAKKRRADWTAVGG